MGDNSLRCAIGIKLSGGRIFYCRIERQQFELSVFCAFYRTADDAARSERYQCPMWSIYADLSLAVVARSHISVRR